MENEILSTQEGSMMSVENQGDNVEFLIKKNEQLKTTQENLMKDLQELTSRLVDHKSLQQTIVLLMLATEENTAKYLKLEQELKEKKKEAEILKEQVKQLEGLATELTLVENPDQINLINQLQGEGVVTSKLVEKVMKSIDRKDFCIPNADPYVDSAQPIGHNTTISAPHMHAIQLELIKLNLKFSKKTLDIGCGSGYFTTAMAKLMPEGSVCIGIDHVPKIIDQARENVKRNHASFIEEGRIQFVIGDGREGYEAEAPYNVIYCGGAVNSVPQKFLDQLANEGCLLLPVGEDEQFLTILYKRSNGEIIQEELNGVGFGRLQSIEEQCPEDE